MIQTKDWILFTGLVVSCIGYDYLPHGQDLDARNDLSLFAELAGGGAFLSLGGIMLAIGVIISLLSFFVPRK